MADAEEEEGGGGKGTERECEPFKCKDTLWSSREAAVGPFKEVELNNISFCKTAFAQLPIMDQAHRHRHNKNNG